MSRQHPKRLRAAGISEYRLTELKAVCRQYPAYKKWLTNARAGIVDRPEGRSSAWHKPDPTGNAAIRIADSMAARRVKLIEQSANAVSEPIVARGLLKYVTEGTAYDYQHPRPPVGRNQFYILALLFYIEMDRRME